MNLYQILTTFGLVTV